MLKRSQGFTAFIGCAALFALAACSSKGAEPIVYVIGGTGAANGAGGNAMSGGGGSESECTRFEDRDGDGVFRTHFDACETPIDERPVTSLLLQEDCDDDNSSRSQGALFYADADGDGYAPLATDPIWSCLEEELSGYTNVLGDCDDSDADAHVLRYPDEDGDGVGAGGVDCVAANAPGTSDLGNDCDDEDQTKSGLSYFDEDQDGDPSWVPVCSSPAGSDLNQGKDCDDSDPNIFFDAEGEVPFDEDDTDCDGVEFPVFYYGEEGPGALIELTDPPRCEGRALSMVALDTPDSSVRQDARFLQLFNRGSERLEGVILDLSIDSLSSLTPSLEVPSIEPGEIVRSPALSGFERRVRVVIEGDRGECEFLNELAALTPINFVVK